MPYPMKEIVPAFTGTLARIEDAIYQKLEVLRVEAYLTPEPVGYGERTSGSRSDVRLGQKWGDLWDCAWFHFTGDVPQIARGQKVVLLIDVNGEACIYDDNGCPVQGLTNVNSEFDYSLGKPGKRVVDVAECAEGGEKIDLWADAGCNDLFGSIQESGCLKEAHIALCCEELRQLYYDFEVLLDFLKHLPENSARFKSISHAINSASLLMNEYNESEAKSARQVLAKELLKKGGDASLAISAVGHAHIDLAWLWPIRETKRKALRTFSTVLRMMEKYPDYVFGASQPQLFQWVKESSPALYRKVMDKVLTGRFELQGGMWVEADTNLSSGEALVRQMLYGKRFFKKEFNQDMKILWLPDVFGYSGALPQIMKKSGIDYFMTIKLSWNTHTKFPHHSFHWTGIDGSQVLAHMPPEGTYNSPAAPRSVRRIEREYADAGLSEQCLMLFGIGDGGGGPGEEHLERLRREKNLEGLLPVTQETSLHFFKKLERNSGELKTWQGELYLEKHQGTYTTQARNKRFNRKSEFALRELEFVSMLALLKGSSEFRYPVEEFSALWKEVLLYQFHDILPGSSIKRVYDETTLGYKRIHEEIGRGLQKAYTGLLVEQSKAAGTKAVFNSLSWNRTEWIEIDSKWHRVNVPAMGFKVLEEQPGEVAECCLAEEALLENDLLRITLGRDGTIASIFDKEQNREVILTNACGNKLMVYYDDGDAWDFSIQYRQRPAGQFRLESTLPVVNGPRAELKQTYSFGSSRLDQCIVLMQGSRRIDFITRVLWAESSKMLRTSFEVAVDAQEAVCDIQFGSIKRPAHRNNETDMAKEEICAHKWVDLSEPEYGVALINDCKYGYCVNRNLLDLNLLRSSSYPGIEADRGEHEFTYSLFPHPGDHRLGEVNQAAYELNVPLSVKTLEQEGKTFGDSFSLLSVDRSNIIVEAVKKAEDSDDMILRLYESHGSSCSAVMHLSGKYEAVFEADLMEEEQKSVHCFVEDGDTLVKVDFGPFEIKTLKVRR